MAQKSVLNKYRYILLEEPNMPKKFSELTEDIFEILSEVNDHDARELHLYADNHADLHRQRTTPVHKNLRNKMAAGTYDHNKAKQAFKHVADDAAKRYKKEHGHHFDVATRKHVAGKMADRFHDEAKSGDHDHHLHKKYKGHKVKESVEQVDELDRSTLKSYQAKATKDNQDRAVRTAHSLGVNFNFPPDKKDMHKLRKRRVGIDKAKARTAEEVDENYEARKVMRKIGVQGIITPKGEIKVPMRDRKRLDSELKKNKIKNYTISNESFEVEEEKKNKIKVKLNPKKKIGYEVKSVGPGGKTTVTKRRDMPGKDDIGESTEVMESFEFQFADKETAQEFMREISQKRLGSSTGTADGKVRTDGPAGAGVGSPTRAHQQMAKIMKKHGGKLLRTDEGPRMKRVFKEDIELDELNRDTLKSYARKAHGDVEGIKNVLSSPKEKGPVSPKHRADLEREMRNRKKGGQKAIRKAYTSEDTEQVDEVIQQFDHDNTGQKVGYTNKKLSSDQVSKLRKKYPKGSVEKDNDGNHVVYTGKYRKEDTEQVDELSAKTLRKYKDKARKDHSDTVAKGYDAKSGKLRSDFEARRLKRKAGFTKAMNKLIAKEDVEQVDELKSDTLRSYVHKRSGQVRSDLSTGKHSPKTNKKAKGVSAALSRLDARKNNLEPKLKREEVDEAMRPYGPAGLNPNFSGGMKAAQKTPEYQAYLAKVKADKKKRDAKIEKEREMGIRSKYEEVETNETTTMGQAVSGRRADPGTMSNNYARNRAIDKRRGDTAKATYQRAKAQRDRTTTDSTSGLSVKQNRVQKKASAAMGRELERLHKKGYKTAFEQTALERRAEKEKMQAVAAAKAAKADRNRRKARAALRTYRSEKRRADSLGEAKEMFTAVAIKNGKVVDQLRDLERKEFKDAAKYLKSTNKGAKISFENKSGKVVQTEGYDSKQALADVRKQTEKNQKARLKQEKDAKKFVQKHDCATHVEHVEFGEGQPIHGQHAAPDENGNIAWYDVMFEHGVEKNMSTDDLTILVSEMHENHDHHGEKIDELKKSTLQNYRDRAKAQQNDIARRNQSVKGPLIGKDLDQMIKRGKGINKVDKKHGPVGPGGKLAETHLVQHGDGNYVMTTDGDKVKFVTGDKSKAKRFSKNDATKFANKPRPNSKKPSGRVVRAEEVELDEASPEGFEGTVKAMKKHKDIDNPYALAHYMKKKGYKSHKNPDGSDLQEKNIPTNPSLWSKMKSQAKSKFDVYPSAYANAWAAKKYKAAGGGWKKG